MSVELTPDQLHLEVLKVMGWSKCRETSPCNGWHNYNLSPSVRREPPPLTLDLMWQAIHPDKPLAEEITRQAKEFLKAKGIA